jgi:hypothetical protein
VQRYVAGGYEGVHYRIPRGVKHASLEFLLPLPGLRYLSVQGPVTDGSAVNAIGSLERLTLLTRSKVPLAVDRLHQPWRRPTPGSGRPARIDRVAVAVPGRMAGSGPVVSRGQAEADLAATRRAAARLSLDGVEGCAGLRELEVLDYRLPSLTPLRDRTALERIWLSGPRRLPADNNLDLDDLAGTHHWEAFG